MLLIRYGIPKYSRSGASPFYCYGIVCLMQVTWYPASFRVDRDVNRPDCSVSLYFFKGWCAVMAFLKRKERTKERFVLLLLLLA